MTFTITLGWWIIPTIITILSIIWFFWMERDTVRGGDFDLSAIGTAMILGLALNVSLIAWLIWALFFL